MNTSTGLGKKAFTFFLYRHMAPAAVCLMVAILAAILGNALVNGIVDLVSVAGPVSHSSVLAISSFTSNGIFALVAIALILAMIAFVRGSIEYRNFSFTLEDLNLKVRHGILSTTEVSMPYRQIKGVSIERSIDYRMFGLSRLVLNTTRDSESAGNTDDKIILEPIDNVLADEVREILERKIGVQVIERAEEAVDHGSATPTTHL